MQYGDTHCFALQRLWGDGLRRDAGCNGSSVWLVAVLWEGEDMMMEWMWQRKARLSFTHFSSGHPHCQMQYAQMEPVRWTQALQVSTHYTIHFSNWMNKQNDIIHRKHLKLSICVQVDLIVHCYCKIKSQWTVFPEAPTIYSVQRIK